MIFTWTRHSLPIGLRKTSVYISWFFRIFVLIICFTAGYYYMLAFLSKPEIIPELQHLRVRSKILFKILFQSLKSLVSSAECKVPRLDPWDPMVIPYYQRAEPLNCRPIQSQVVVFKDGIIHVNLFLT